MPFEIIKMLTRLQSLWYLRQKRRNCRQERHSTNCTWGGGEIKPPFLPLLCQLFHFEELLPNRYIFYIYLTLEHACTSGFKGVNLITDKPPQIFECLKRTKSLILAFELPSGFFFFWQTIDSCSCCLAAGSLLQRCVVANACDPFPLFPLGDKISLSVGDQ